MSHEGHFARRTMMVNARYGALQRIMVTHMAHSTKTALVAGLSHGWLSGGGGLPEIRRGGAALLRETACHAVTRKRGTDIDLRQQFYSSRGPSILAAATAHLPVEDGMGAKRPAPLWRRRAPCFPGGVIPPWSDSRIHGRSPWPTRLSRGSDGAIVGCWLQPVAYACF